MDCEHCNDTGYEDKGKPRLFLHRKPCRECREEIQYVTYYRNKDIDDMTAEELREAVVELGELLQQAHADAYERSMNLVRRER